MNYLLYPTYFPNIAHFIAMVQSDKFCFEIYDNYQKQTYRNRCTIYGANGRLDLNIPVRHSQRNRQLTKDIEIANTEDWQSQHFKSLHSAYSRSPFYEFYIDELEPLFSEPAENLADFNRSSIEKVFSCLQLPFGYETTNQFEKHPREYQDARGLANARKEIVQDFEPYTQVFSNANGFIPNLSILDLLFNEGPNAVNYLNNQRLYLP